MMASLFKNTNNTRFLANNFTKYIRSDAPTRLDETEIQWLIENNVRTIIDLRSPAEATLKPCTFVNRSEFSYYNIPVTGGNIVHTC